LDMHRGGKFLFLLHAMFKTKGESEYGSCFVLHISDLDDEKARWVYIVGEMLLRMGWIEKSRIFYVRKRKVFDGKDRRFKIDKNKLRCGLFFYS